MKLFRCRSTAHFVRSAAVLFLSMPIFGRAQDPASDPVTLVRAASWNELHSAGNRQPYRFLLHKTDTRLSNVKEIIETRDGDVARLIEKNGKPLDPNEQDAEVQRLTTLLHSPELQEHRRKREKEDAQRGDEMVRLLPDAFLYTYEGIVAGPSGPAYRLTFKPNPKFEPPDREAEVYAGMAGELWIDQSEKRLAKIDAHLINDVNFGWGIVGRLYKGGSILVEQKNVGMHHWEQTRMVLNLTGKILMMKNISFQTTENETAFQPVDKDITYQQAIQLLLETPATSPGSNAEAELTHQ